MGNTTRRLYLQVTDNGSPLPQVLGVQTMHAVDPPVAQCFVTLPREPSGLYYDHALVVTSGAGNNVQRFSGMVRERRFTLPAAAGGRQYRVTGRGNLTRAAEYQNKDNPSGTAGGLTIFDLVGSQPATDQAVKKAVLTRCGVIYSAGNIGGTGRLIGGTFNGTQPDPFMWPNGQPTILLGQSAQDALRAQPGAGMDGVTFLKRWDAIAAQVDSTSTPTTGGFYLTYDAPSGAVYSTRMGGRPRGTPDVPPFTEGVDISEGETIRSFPAANSVIQRGYDDGSNPAAYTLLQGSNPIQPNPPTPIIFTAPANPMIEWSTVAQATVAGFGMDTDTIAATVYLDVNREAVEGRYVTPRDDLIAPGMTILVQGPGGAPNALGVGELLWVKAVETHAGLDGWYQLLTVIGGGSPDSGNPAVGT